MSTWSQRLVPTLLVLLLSTAAVRGCISRLGYRNFWVELYSTTPCGDVGRPPLGVCSIAATCLAMSGENLGTYNCPPSSGTCCRPLASCSATTAALNMLWESEDYATTVLQEESTCTLSVVPSSDTCFIRVDFDDLDLQSVLPDKCGYSHLKINSQYHGNGFKICGTLNHKTTFVKVGTSVVGLPTPIQFELNMAHIPHKYSVRFNHVKCSSVKKFSDNRRYRNRRRSDSSPSIRANIKKNKDKPKIDGKELEYMGRMFAVSYTRDPLIRSCPVTFLSKDLVIGSASCTLRLGGPGTSKGMMVVHGAVHKEPRSAYPRTVADLAKYVAANGVVVKKSVFHPMYNHNTHEHDIALYFLNKTVETAEPVMLPVPIDDFVDLSVFMARYHYYEVADDITILSKPEEIMTRIVSNHECITSSIAEVAAVTSNNTLCLEATPRTDSPCQGEVGTPIVHLGGSGAISLLGLMMGGYHHCDGKHSYAEPFIKIINYLDFIDVATSPSVTVLPHSPSGSGFTRWYNSLRG